VTTGEPREAVRVGVNRKEGETSMESLRLSARVLASLGEANFSVGKAMAKLAIMEPQLTVTETSSSGVLVCVAMEAVMAAIDSVEVSHVAEGQVVVPSRT
jgi:hypothetical protein